MDESLTLTKISLPGVEKLYHRQQLAEAFAKALVSPVIWISSPAGSGKTVFVADYIRQCKLSALWYQIDAGDTDIASLFYYLGLAEKKASPRRRKPLPLLTPEYMAGLQTFTRNFFRELFSRLHTPAVIVFDNYQDVAADSPLHEVLQLAVTELPQHLHLVFISRQDPPPAYARLLMSGQITRIGWSEFSLSRQEVSEFVRFRNGVELDKDVLESIHAQFQGWITGLVLWLEQRRLHQDYVAALYPDEQDVVFSYFANEIFTSSEPEMREFLIKTACLPFIEHTMAVAISGSGRAKKIISTLVKNNYFTTHAGGNTYRYHPLFRDYLLHEAKSELDEMQLSENRRQAARVLSESGYTEEAVTLVLESEDWQFAPGLIMQLAPVLLQQGRNTTLAGWIGAMPRELLATMPWMVFWSGMAHLMLDPVMARKELTQAYELFMQENDPLGLYSAWSGIVDSYLIGMDQYTGLDVWFDEYDKVSAHYPVPVFPEIETRVTVSMMAALVMRRPWQVDIEEWIERAITLTRQSGNASLRVHCLFHAGYFDLCYRAAKKRQQIVAELDTLYEEKTASALDRIRILLFKTFFLQYHLYTSNESSQNYIAKALEIAEQSGVIVLNHMLLGNLALSLLGSNELTTVQEPITRMVASAVRMGPWDEAFYHFLLGAYAWMTGDTATAVNELRQADHMNSRLGEFSSTLFGKHLLARALIDHGEFDEARQYMRLVWNMTNKINGYTLIQEAVMSEAFLAMRSKEDDKAERFLRRYFDVDDIQQLHFGRTFFWRPGIIREIAVRALEQQIGVPQLSCLIRQYRQLLGEPPTHLDNWPLPIKIHTLGRFSLLKDDEPLRFSVKAQNKPLDLLKVLIAMGGREVSKEKIMEALWPDAEGDMANKSFDTTLHRLRKLLGREALLLQEGRLTLNPQQVWVDVWAFERQLSALEQLLATTEPDLVELQTCLERLRKLYQGDFLHRETETGWMLGLRERLKQRWLRIGKRLVRAFGHAGQCKQAIEIYLKMIELDDLAEEFYRGLMGCYAARGQQAEAIAVYGRCQTMLNTILGVTPSAETERLYDAIQQGDQSWFDHICDTCRARNPQYPLTN